MPHLNHRSGFTLLEMGVVLAIVGVLVGGIMVGQSLIRSAQIRNMLGEYDIYVKALKEFQDKYNALPGDMKNATSFWGTDPGGCPATSNTTTKTATCNGDGNGHIGDSTTAGSLSGQAEWFRAWQQLADAGLISGQFTGVNGSGGSNEAVLGQNVPASQLSGAGWTLYYYLMTPAAGANTGLWNDQYGHVLSLGAYVSASYTKGPILSAADALNIDRKADDGLPGRGRIRAWRTSVLANCTANDTAQDAQTYNITASNTGLSCALVFIPGF